MVECSASSQCKDNCLKPRGGVEKLSLKGSVEGGHTVLRESVRAPKRFSKGKPGLQNKGGAAPKAVSVFAGAELCEDPGVPASLPQPHHGQCDIIQNRLSNGLLQTEHQKKVASSDWTNVIIPGDELFTGGQQTVRWRLDNLEENNNYECLVQVR